MASRRRRRESVRSAEEENVGSSIWSTPPPPVILESEPSANLPVAPPYNEPPSAEPTVPSERPSDDSKPPIDLEIILIGIFAVCLLGYIIYNSYKSKLLPENIQSFLDKILDKIFKKSEGELHVSKAKSPDAVLDGDA